MNKTGIITTRNKARRIMATSLGSSVRAYRVSPEDIGLQIRREKDLIHVNLTFDEAWQLVDALLDALPLDRKPHQ